MQLRERFTFANVVSVLALVVALAGTGGAAYALGKNTVGSPQIINKSVRTADLAPKAVKPARIAPNAVRGGKVKNGSLSGADLRPKAKGLTQAGVTVSPAGSLQAWFNRTGGQPTITRTAVGKYRITVPGVTASALDAIVAVTAIDNEAVDPNTCVSEGTVSGDFKVRCFDGAGDAQDEYFSFVVHWSQG